MKQRSYPIALSLITIVTSTNHKHETRLYLDQNLHFPLGNYNTPSLLDSLHLLLERHHLQDAVYNGILATHSSIAADGKYEFTFVVSCSVPEREDSVNFYVVNDQLLEGMRKRLGELESYVGVVMRACVGFVEKNQSLPLLQIFDEQNSIPIVPLTIPPPSDLVVFVLIIENGKILLIKEIPEKGGGWYLPAGKFEKCENLISAAKRETKEEAGVEVEVQNIAKIIYYWGQCLDFIVTAKVVGGKLKDHVDKESQGAAWFDFKTVLSEVKSKATRKKYRNPSELDFFFSEISEGRVQNAIQII